MTTLVVIWLLASLPLSIAAGKFLRWRGQAVEVRENVRARVRIG